MSFTDRARQKQENVRRGGFGTSPLQPRVHYSSALYKKALRDDNVEVDDHPLVVLPPEDNHKTVKVTSETGGSGSGDNRVSRPRVRPLPTAASPTEPEMPVTEELTAPPTTRPTTKKAHPTRKPTLPTTHPTIVNNVPTAGPPNGEANATNINLNLEISGSETSEGTPATQIPQQAVAITQAPTPPPPQIIIAQPPATPPPPQPVVINAAPTSPPSAQQMIIHNAPSPERVVIHEVHSAKPVIVNEATQSQTDPLVIQSSPSPPSVVLTPDVSPSQHSVVVAAPPSPSVVIASPMSSPESALTLMGMQSPMSAVVMGQMPTLGYPLGMQSPFAFLPSPWLRPPLAGGLGLGGSLSPLGGGLGGSLYDPQLLTSLTSLFSNALQSQSQPGALTNALVRAAIQAQTRNQPPDLLTTALTQALAQRMALPNNDQADTTRLIQALTTALQQIQSQAPPGQPQTQPQALAQPQAPAPAPLPAVSPIPAPAQPEATYQVLPVQPVSPQPALDSNSPSMSSVGKALASALVRAARKLARRKNFDSTRTRQAWRTWRPRPATPYYPRSYAPYAPRPFYPGSYVRRFGAPARSSITRRSGIARWHTPPNQLATRVSGCSCCRCC